MTTTPGTGEVNASRRVPHSDQELLVILTELRSACQDVTGRSIRASAESNQWRARLAILHGSTLAATLTLAYHQRATEDADHWRLVRHRWTCRYAAIAADVMRTVLARTQSGQRPPSSLGGGVDWGSVTLLTCPPLPDPDELATGSVAEQHRIVEAHQAVTEAADAAGLLNEMNGYGEVPLEVAQTAGELTDRLLSYARAVHAAARRQLKPPPDPASP